MGLQDQIEILPRGESLARLGLGIKDYYGIARNLNRIGKISDSNQMNVLTMSYIKFDESTFLTALELIDDMTKDKDVYEIAGLKFHEGPPGRVFKTTVMHYLLRKRFKNWRSSTEAT